LTQFSGQGTGVCKFATVSRDINEFAKILCNGRSVQRELLEALYLFNNQNVVEEEDANSPDQRAEEFVSQATSQISEIRTFMNAVPMRSIGALMYRTADWTPPQMETADDWFLRFKTNWRKIFDRKWESWLADQRHESVRRQMAAIFGLDAMPLLPNRPWSGSSEVFKYDYMLGFLAYFFKNVFPKYTQILKIILLEGKFYQNEQRMAFTDALDKLLQQEKNMDSLMDMLTEQGEYGKFFAQFSNDVMSRQKLGALMEKIEAQAAGIVQNFLTGCVSLSAVLDAVNSSSKDGRDAAALIIKFQNEKIEAAFRGRLAEVKENMVKITGLLKQIGDMSESGLGPEQMAYSA
jgi:hypothetical protein